MAPELFNAYDFSGIDPDRRRTGVALFPPQTVICRRDWERPTVESNGPAPLTF